MFLFLFVSVLGVEFVVKQTSVYISGSGQLTRSDIMANCDYQTVTEIFVGEGITSFTTGVFNSFASLKKLNLPSSLQSSTGQDIRNCYVLETITLAEGSQNLEVDEFGVLYNKGKTCIIRFPPKKNAKNFKFPSETTTIGEGAFQYCLTQWHLTISKSITKIIAGAFHDSIGIGNIYFENGSPITILNNFTFSVGLRYIFLTKNISKIESQAFYSCINLETVEFENESNLIEIQDNAFYATKIKEFTFPDKCSIIRSSIFNLNPKLETIYIPASLVNIHTNAFSGASGLKNISINENNPIYTVIPPGVLMLKNRTKYLFVPKLITNFEIQSEVVEFGMTMFQLSTELTSVSVDSKNTKFSAYNGIIYSKGYKNAIACIGGISSVETNPECISIGHYCFYQCRKLKSIKMNEGITSCGTYSFGGINISSIGIPSTMQNIGVYCFRSSTVKNIIIMGGGPKTIQSYAFEYCTIEQINFGINLRYIDWGIFRNSKINSVTFNEDCPLSKISGETFLYVQYLKTIRIPKNIEQINGQAFAYVRSLSTIEFAEGSKISVIDTMAFRQTNISSILLPQSLTFLGANAFSECRNLRSISFARGMNLKNLGGGAFRSCISLPTVTIPASVLLFDPSAFVFCSNLMSINVPNENLNYKSVDGIVYNKLNDKLICCPGGRVNAMIFKHIIVIGSNAFYGCSKLENLTFEEGCRLEVIEDGTFFSCTSLRRVDLPTSLITVQQSAFSGCTLLAIITFTDYARADLGADSIFADCVSLTTISFGRFCALKNLGSSIFSNCIKLKTINIPANCTKIGDGAFSGCKSLSDIRFESNSNLKYLSSSAFVGCTSLLTYNVPDSFKEITSACFGGAQSITTVNIASMINIDRIGPNAFSSIPMTRINIGLGTTISLIDEYAFQNTRISSLEILSSVIISRYSFKGCSLLRTISVPLATSIWNNAFEGCTMLESFSIENTVTISSFVFKGCTNLRSVKIPKLISEQSSITIFSASPSSSMRMRKRILSTGSTSTIPIGLFDGCKSLSSLTIRNNIESISDYCFRDCISLIYDIPRTVTMIGNESFKNCIKVNNIPSDVQYFGNMSFYGTNIKKVILINRYTTYIGSSSFENTPLRIIFYCGNRDFSNFDKSFEDDSQVVVTYAYEQSTFCGSHAYHIQSNMCNDIMATNYDRIDILKKELKSHMKKNLLFLCAIDPLGLW